MPPLSSPFKIIFALRYNDFIIKYIYANAIIEGLDEIAALDFTKTQVPPTVNDALEKRATAIFDYLVREELPAFITYQYIKVVSATVSQRIQGSLASNLREASEFYIRCIKTA